MKILFFADSHLGFDLPVHPRVSRRRRGHDFFANYRQILDFGRAQGVDLIVHGGDLFFRSKVPRAIVDQAYAPLLDLANSGIPIYIVPGNHERSRLPNHLWLSHRHIHVFDRPRTFRLQVDGLSIALCGFPFARKVRSTFQSLLSQTGYLDDQADLRFLCLHQTFEGATVGPGNFTFLEGPDTIPGAAIPSSIEVVLSGHIHRAQVLNEDLAGRSLAAPVVYPGSIERTSFAERREDKYFAQLEVLPEERANAPTVTYHRLKARPMVVIQLPRQADTPREAIAYLERRLVGLDPDSIVRVRAAARQSGDGREILSEALLREIAPATMNIAMGARWRDRSPKRWE